MRRLITVTLHATHVLDGVKHNPGDRVRLPADHYLARLLKKHRPAKVKERNDADRD